MIVTDMTDYLDPAALKTIILNAIPEKQQREFYPTDPPRRPGLPHSGSRVPLVLDLRIAHDRVGSSVDPTLNGHLKYPNNLDQSLNDEAAEKIRKYRTDYNNRPSSAVSLAMCAVMVIR
jgi:hypothetical protein